MLVKKVTGISGILLLCLYSLILMHNTLPHGHSEDIADIPKETSHHGHHHHHHHHGNHQHDLASSEGGLINFILGFLGGFDHQDLGEGHFSLYVGEDVVLRLGALESFPVAPIMLEKPLALCKGDVPVYEYIHPPPLDLNNSFCDTAPLRGPPRIS